MRDGLFTHGNSILIEAERESPLEDPSLAIAPRRERLLGDLLASTGPG
jgi:hypothetical protein